MTTFMIPACNMGALSERLEKLNRRAAKLSMASIQTRVLGMVQAQYGADGRLRSPTKYEVEVTGLAPKLPGWEFVGTLEHTPAGNVMRILPGRVVPESYRTAPPACDHCKTSRRRKDTYLVRSDAGELKQVARSCIRDFLGHVSPEHIAWLATLLRDFDRLQGETGSGGGKLTFAVQDIVELAAASVRQFGWVSRAASQAYTEKSEGRGQLRATVDRVWFELDPSPEARKQRDKLGPADLICVTPEDRKLADVALTWARTLTPTDDYLHNLKVIAHKPYVEFRGRDGGLLASLVSAYQREVLKQVQERDSRAARAFLGALSNYQGQVGARADWTLTLRKRIILGGNDFGTHADAALYLYCFADATGNEFTWVTAKTGQSVVKHSRTTVIPFVEGRRYTVRGTVKEHREYRGVKQTSLTRCALTELAKEAA